MVQLTFSYLIRAIVIDNAGLHRRRTVHRGLAGQFPQIRPDLLQLSRQNQKFESTTKSSTRGRCCGRHTFMCFAVMMLMIGIGGLMATAQVAPDKVGATAPRVIANPRDRRWPHFGGGFRSHGPGANHELAFALSRFSWSACDRGPHVDVWSVISMALVF
jgi:hypothetical protein